MKRLGTLLLWLALAGPAFADQKPSLIVSVDVGSSGLSADAVRAAIGKELGVATASEGDGESRLAVRITGDRATLVFTRGGEKIERVVDLPKEPGARVEVIALLAGNLARDEASALLASLAPKPAEAEPAPPEPPPAAEPAKAPPAESPKPAVAEPAEKKPAEAAVSGGESRWRRGPLFANLSLYSPIAITPDAAQRSFDIELGLAYSKIGGLTGFGLTVGHLRVGGPAEGVGVTGLWTRVDGDQKGAFASGIFSQGGGQLRGAEGSGIVTLRSGDLQGFQGSGVFGSARGVQGAQLAGIAAWSDGALEGFQGAGALARARGSVQGAQISAVNIGGDLRGAQLGLVNIGGNVRRRLDPLGLVQKGGLWYLVAAERDQVRIYRVANIQQLNVLDQPSTRPKRFDLSRHWKTWTDAFEERLMRERARVLVSEEGLRILRAVMPAAAEVAEATCVPSDRPGWFAAALPFETPDYSARQILRLGTEVQVLAPEALRIAVLREAQAVVAQASQGVQTTAKGGKAEKKERATVS